MKVTYLSADDWAGVYINDKLVCEGHNISPREWLEVIEKVGEYPGEVVVVDKGETDEAYDVIGDWGRCPPELTTGE